jgi:hypothetical protein
MPSRNTIWVIVGVTAIIYFVGLWVLKAPAGGVLMRLSGLAVLVVSLLLAAFDRFLWKLLPKLPLINYFAKRPVLHGTWKGTFESDYVYPETGKREGPTEAYLVARQTFSSLHLRFITRRSASESMACELKTKSDGRYGIYAVYENRPPLLAQNASPVHRGGLILEVVGDPAHALEGSYWTDRPTKGDMKLDGYSKKVHDDFDSARGDVYS